LKKVNLQERFRLSKEQLLLMRAAVQDDPGALESWQQWLGMVDLEGLLDTTSFRLLPLVYHNLAAQQLEHPLKTRLKGIYRRTWLENQLTLLKLLPLITQLHASRIPVVFQDDLTSILRLYDGQGMRRLFSLDILIQPGDIHRILALFEDLKIRPKVANAVQFLMAELPLEIWSPFDLPLSVSTIVLPALQTPAPVFADWPNHHSAILSDIPVSTLDLETHFIRSCLRSVADRSEAAFFALIDVAWMLRKRGVAINWERVIELVQATRLAWPVIEALKEVATFTKMPKVHELLQQVRKLPLSWKDRFEGRIIYPYRPSPDLFFRTARRLLIYRHSPMASGPLGFLRYLSIIYGGGRLQALPRLLLRQLGSSSNRSKRQGNDQ
jgi:hypothetical protein